MPRSQWHAARRESFRAARPLAAVSVPLSEAVGRVAASDVSALCDVPHYASSAMDGWAVAGAPPWRLLDGNGVASAPLESGQARTIVTGGLIPPNAVGVLRSEHGAVRTEGGVVLLDRNADARADEPATDEHVRPAGEEVTASDTVIHAGTVLNPAHIAVAAVCGHDEVSVLPRPSVSLVLTGDEVVTSGIPEPGHVRDSFGPQLPSFIALLGGEVTASTRLPDNLELLVAAIIANPDADLVITTGGTGGSDVDHLHAALAELGATTHIEGVAMRPGGPSLLAELPDGRFLVCLPGNPLAAMIGLLTLAQPLIAGLAGLPEPVLGSVTTGRELTGRPGLVRLLPYRLRDGVAVKSQWFGSGMLRGLAEADGVLIAPSPGAAEGEDVETIPLPW
ncbi:molybdopterin molybdotransferase MoeA [Parafrigoribacterium humi]|uniref:molybdopterin molybdotransferase MoeA n=1 Tax=Parafrigoribacterium humi TaxID=3144664 RepID=UPI0032EB2B07